MRCTRMGHHAPLRRRHSGARRERREDPDAVKVLAVAEIPRDRPVRSEEIVGPLASLAWDRTSDVAGRHPGRRWAVARRSLARHPRRTASSGPCGGSSRTSRSGGKSRSRRGTSRTATSRPRRHGRERGPAPRFRPRRPSRSPAPPRSRGCSSGSSSCIPPRRAGTSPGVANRSRRTGLRRGTGTGARWTGARPHGPIRPATSYRPRAGYHERFQKRARGAHWLNVSTFSKVCLRYLIRMSRFRRRWLSYQTFTRSARSLWRSSRSARSRGWS